MDHRGCGVCRCDENCLDIVCILREDLLLGVQMLQMQHPAFTTRLLHSRDVP